VNVSEALLEHDPREPAARLGPDLRAFEGERAAVEGNEPAAG
jgi:hypothetical protein